MIESPSDPEILYDDEREGAGEVEEAESGRSPGSRSRTPPPSEIESMADALDYADPRPAAGSRTGKGPYGTRLSNALAVLIANRLRPQFPGILPDADGRGQESRARTAKGYKKLDVNYSTVELGLALGVSLKTINYRDAGTGRYTKNYSRVDNELRAEATDYHERQPYAVLAGLLLLPLDACEDAGQARGADAHQGASSFGAAVRYFRIRARRRRPDDLVELFERFFVGIYGYHGSERGYLRFYDVERLAPPRNRRPRDDETLTLDETMDAIRETYDARNNPAFVWADD